MATLDPATWTVWNVANSAWIHGSALYFHHKQLSKLADSLPDELRQIHRRGRTHSAALLKFGRVLRQKQYRVLDTDDDEVSQDILNIVEEISTALFQILHGITELETLPKATRLDSIWSYFGLSTPVDEWKRRKDDLMLGADDISSALADFNHLVTGSNAERLKEICDRLKYMEENATKRKSLLEKIFGQSQRRGPKSSGRPDRVDRADRDDRDDRSIIRDMRETAEAYVKGLCEKSDTYRWYKFLNDTTAIILVGEVGDIDNIQAIILWFTGNGCKAEFHEVDQEKTFSTYPGVQRNHVTVLLSEQRELKLKFRSVNDANSFRHLMDRREILYTARVISVKSRPPDARDLRYKRLPDLLPPERDGDITCMAEVFKPDIYSSTSSMYELEQPVLRLWPRRFVAGEDLIYVHLASYATRYEVEDRTLALYSAIIAKTKEANGFLHDDSDECCGKLVGDFKIQFEDSKKAKKVYDLIVNQSSSDEDN